MKVVRKVVQALPFLILVAVAVPIVGVAYSEGAKRLGFKTVTVEVVGTGSMYPSLFWDKSEGGPEDSEGTGIQEYRSSPLMYERFAGMKVFGKVYGRRSINYGDMVAFTNSETATILEKEGKSKGLGFIKRVIAMPGDTIELRDGYVYKNGHILDEPYINLPRSTYGGSGLADCKELTIPADHYFVLGDNRKISSDSRYELGLIKDEDISYVLPYADQSMYRLLWRDTSKDASLIGTPTLDRNEFYELVNKTRSAGSKAGLKPTQLLAKSASLRGSKLLQNQNTPYTLKSALAEAGYDNIVVGEFVSHGNFTANELLQNILAFSDTAKQLMNAEYQDIGVTATTREVDGCPTQVIVGHFGGYIPAQYEEESIKSWQGLRDNLNAVIPSWEKAVGYNTIDQEKLAELLTIMRRRLTLAELVVKKMEDKLWLSADDQARIKADDQDASKANALADELNKP
jgi:signal peptidase I